MRHNLEVPKYIQIKNRYLGWFIALGLVIGPIIGYWLGHPAPGIVVGGFVGFIFGSVIGHKKSKKHME